MTRSVQTSCFAIGLLSVLFGDSSLSVADEPAATTGIDAKVAYERLKTLAGEWKVTETMGGHGAHGGKITYKVTAAGTTVMETFFPGSDHEMVSMYHLDGDDLRMTHYCAVGNQPRLKLDLKASKPDFYSFIFDGGTGFDPAKDLHIHSGRITFQTAGKVESEWSANLKGEKAMSTKFSLSRD